MMETEERRGIEEIVREAVETGRPATVEEALWLNEHYPTDELCDAADKIRMKWSGNQVHTCSIVNARSGRCGEDCKWCAQSAHHNTGVSEYEHIGRDEMMRAFHINKEYGVGSFSLVTSGRRVAPSHMAYFCNLFKEAAAEGGMKLCASMGLLEKEQLQQLYDAGVRKYHCNLETSPGFFPTLCTTHTTADKLATIRAAREVGLEVCSGGIIGMRETMRDRLELAETVREAGAASIPINILNPIPGTTLENTPPISDDEIARSVALMRMMAPKCTIHFAGGRARLAQKTVERILRGGANGAMMGDLLTTVGNKAEEDLALFRRAEYEVGSGEWGVGSMKYEV